METAIYDPLEAYETRLKDLHSGKAAEFFDDLVQRSGIDIAENRKTVRLYDEYRENLKKLKTKLGWLRFLRVLMCITLILIPLVIWKTTPRIRALRDEIREADQRAEELLAQARTQMQPLLRLFSDRDALALIEAAVPQLVFADSFTVKQEADMRINYDFEEYNETEQSTLDVLAGHYNENPFLFENKLVHRMGTETYHGYKTITWTESYRDSDGHHRTRTRTETLHATVTKPKPFYNTRVVLNYCAQGGPELSFSRDATHLHKKSDKAIERLVKRGEKKLERKNDLAVSQNDDFVSMSNSEFEVLFDALDRTDEVQFRTLFTPLAQTNMVSLLRSQTGYGDDFHFIKNRRTNRIISDHSQGRVINLLAKHYASHSYDIVRENFLGKNAEFFRAVYFDFAPLLAIPIYQERPVHSLKPIPDYTQQYALKESEALANAVEKHRVVHAQTKTPAILKSSFVAARDGMDETCITAYSYDIEKRVDIVSVYGGDGRYHNVSVEWDDYLPLEAQNHFFVSTDELAESKTVFARRDGLCIFQL